MTIPTQIQNRPLGLAHVPHVPDLYTAIFCCLCNRGERSPPPSMSSNPLAVEGVFLSKGGHSPQIDHLCSRSALFVLKWRTRPTPRLLAIVARSADASRLTHHIERHPIFHHSTADLHSVSCTLRDRDVLTLCSWQRHNLLRSMNTSPADDHQSKSIHTTSSAIPPVLLPNSHLSPPLISLGISRTWKTPAECGCLAVIVAQTFEHTLRGTRWSRHESRCFFRCILCFWWLGTLSSKLEKETHPKTLSSKNTFVQKTLSSKNTFIQNRRQFHSRHFHPKTVSSNDTFIPKWFRSTTLSSKTGFIPNPKPPNSLNT